MDLGIAEIRRDRSIIVLVGMVYDALMKITVLACLGLSRGEPDGRRPPPAGWAERGREPGTVGV